MSSRCSARFMRQRLTTRGTDRPTRTRAKRFDWPRSDWRSCCHCSKAWDQSGSNREVGDATLILTDLVPLLCALHPNCLVRFDLRPGCHTTMCVRDLTRLVMNLLRRASADIPSGGTITISSGTGRSADALDAEGATPAGSRSNM